jgi:hypothetical protein
MCIEIERICAKNRIEFSHTIVLVVVSFRLTDSGLMARACREHVACWGSSLEANKVKLTCSNHVKCWGCYHTKRYIRS